MIALITSVASAAPNTKLEVFEDVAHFDRNARLAHLAEAVIAFPVATGPPDIATGGDLDEDTSLTEPPEPPIARPPVAVAVQ